MGLGATSPKAVAKAKGKAGAKKKPEVVTTACGGRKPWKRLLQCNPSHPPRTYIQGQVEGGKLHLIVEVSQKKMSKNHRAICEQIKEALEKDSLTKEEALQMRKDLLQKDGIRHR